MFKNLILEMAMFEIKLTLKGGLNQIYKICVDDLKNRYQILSICLKYFLQN